MNVFKEMGAKIRKVLQFSCQSLNTYFQNYIDNQPGPILNVHFFNNFHFFDKFNFFHSFPFSDNFPFFGNFCLSLKK